MKKTKRDRLTYAGNFCDIAMCLEQPGGEHCGEIGCSQKQVWERLKAYEDAEAEGRLLALPCKVGDEVWGIRSPWHRPSVKAGEVTEIYFTENMQMGVLVKGVGTCRWGLTAFLTQEEARAAVNKNTAEGYGQEK